MSCLFDAEPGPSLPENIASERIWIPLRPYVEYMRETFNMSQLEVRGKDTLPYPTLAVRTNLHVFILCQSKLVKGVHACEIKSGIAVQRRTIMISKFRSQTLNARFFTYNILILNRNAHIIHCRCHLWFRLNQPLLVSFITASILL